MRPDDSTADDWFAEFLNFGVGVLSLVCLSCSVIWGLVAQDRVLLGPRQRILAQAVHRTTAVASIAFLLVHIGIKLALEHTTWIAAVIPFGLALTDDEAVAGRSFLIGLGTLAGMLMIFVGITGVLRNRFASPAPVAARWRAMHMLAYPAWCAALVHGLYAGRSAKPIFLILYGLSLLGVMAALFLRASPARVKRKVADRVTSLLGLAEQQGRDRLDESRTRAAEASPPRYESGGRRDSRPRSGPPERPEPAARPRYETAERLAPPAPDPANGFAAAYRAVSPVPAAAAPLRGPDRPHGTASGHAAHAGRPHHGRPDDGRAGHGGAARGRPLQHLGQLARPVPAAGRRGPAVGLRPAPGHRIQHPHLRQFGRPRLRLE